MQSLVAVPALYASASASRLRFLWIQTLDQSFIATVDDQSLTGG